MTHARHLKSPKQVQSRYLLRPRVNGASISTTCPTHSRFTKRADPVAQRNSSPPPIPMLDITWYYSVNVFLFMLLYSIHACTIHDILYVDYFLPFFKIVHGF